jgi:hypothetical protein
MNHGLIVHLGVVVLLAIVITADVATSSPPAIAYRVVTPLGDFRATAIQWQSQGIWCTTATGARVFVSGTYQIHTTPAVEAPQ